MTEGLVFIFIVVICNDVEVHEDTRGEYIRQRITFISSCFIGKSFAVLQNMQVINKQHNGIQHEYMIHFDNCKQATYFILPFVTKSSLFPQKKICFFIYIYGHCFYKHLMKFGFFLNVNRFSKTISYYLILRPKQ